MLKRKVSIRELQLTLNTNCQYMGNRIMYHVLSKEDQSVFVSILRDRVSEPLSNITRKYLKVWGTAVFFDWYGNMHTFWECNDYDPVYGSVQKYLHEWILSRPIVRYTPVKKINNNVKSELLLNIPHLLQSTMHAERDRYHLGVIKFLTDVASLDDVYSKILKAKVSIRGCCDGVHNTQLEALYHAIYVLKGIIHRYVNSVGNKEQVLYGSAYLLNNGDVEMLRYMLGLWNPTLENPSSKISKLGRAIPYEHLSHYLKETLATTNNIDHLLTNTGYMHADKRRLIKRDEDLVSIIRDHYPALEYWKNPANGQRKHPNARSFNGNYISKTDFMEKILPNAVDLYVTVGPNIPNICNFTTATVPCATPVGRLGDIDYGVFSGDRGFDTSVHVECSSTLRVTNVCPTLSGNRYLFLLEDGYIEGLTPKADTFSCNASDPYAKRLAYRVLLPMLTLPTIPVDPESLLGLIPNHNHVITAVMADESLVHCKLSRR